MSGEPEGQTGRAVRQRDAQDVVWVHVIVSHRSLPPAGRFYTKAPRPHPLPSEPLGSRSLGFNLIIYKYSIADSEG